MGFWEYTILIMIPVMVFAGYAQNKIRSTYQRYSRVPTRNGLTGYETALRLLQDEGISGVPIREIPGDLTDHYDPRNRSLGLSRSVYRGQSIAAIGVAAHEIGHAKQHARGNALLAFRNQFAPVAQIGSSLAIPLVFIGYFLGLAGLSQFGVVLFSAVVVFQLITVPVEKDASRRALRMLQSGGYLDATELAGAKRVLDAAALTYIASLVVAVAHLFRLMLFTRRS